MIEAIRSDNDLPGRISRADADIIDTFRKNFGFLKDVPVILYGIGDKTKVILEHCREYDIAGLMDKNSTGCLVYGKRVLSPGEAMEAAEHIVIISNYASADLIYRRIAHLEREHGLNIYHLNGTRPGAGYSRNGAAHDDPAAGLTRADMQRLIETHDVISFDIFDTVLSRKCLFPADVFQLVERRLREAHHIDIEFARSRIEAEQAAYRMYGSACTIDNIYAALGFLLRLPPDRLRLARQIEVQVETEHLLPRTAIIESMKHAKDLHKHVVLTSDMYLPSQTIKEILKAKNIDRYDEIAVSCELKKSKYTGDLWPYYKERFEGQRVLHIGDDDFADIEQPERHGITAFKVSTAFELADKTPLHAVTDKARTPDDRIMLGSILSVLSSDPFALHSGRLKIDSLFTAGYCFWGPLVLKFMQWLCTLSLELKLSRILFLSRDGYLLERLYRKLTDTLGAEAFPQGTYFLTSRRAVTVSSIRGRDDIIDAFRLAPYVTRINAGQFLKATFGIHAHDDDAYSSKLLHDLDPEELMQHIMGEYADEIVQGAEKERLPYVDYFASLGVRPSERLGIVNFVSGGVTQHFFEKTFGVNNAAFIYFGTRIDFDDAATRNEVHALYGTRLSPYSGRDSSLVAHYLTAESGFSSPDEQFLRFSGSGTPVFENDNRKRDFSGIAECHRGIEAFFDEMAGRDRNILSREFSTDMIDTNFGVFFSPEVEPAGSIKAALDIRDSFAPDSVVKTLTE